MDRHGAQDGRQAPDSRVVGQAVQRHRQRQRPVRALVDGAGHVGTVGGADGVLQGGGDQHRRRAGEERVHGGDQRVEVARAGGQHALGLQQPQQAVPLAGLVGRGGLVAGGRQAADVAQGGEGGAGEEAGHGGEGGGGG